MTTAEAPSLTAGRLCWLKDWAPTALLVRHRVVSIISSASPYRPLASVGTMVGGLARLLVGGPVAFLAHQSTEGKDEDRLVWPTP